METGGVLDKLFNANGPEWVYPIFDRMMLRFMESPSLIQYLKDAGIVQKHIAPGENSLDALESPDDGEDPQREQVPVIQIVFSKLPDEVIPEVHKIIAMGDINTYEYETNGQSYHGFEVVIPKELTDPESGAAAEDEDHDELEAGITDHGNTAMDQGVG